VLRVLFIGAPVEPVFARGLNYRQRFERTGENTGNLLIGGALRRHIAASSYEHGTHRDPRTVDEEFDLIAIPASNFIFEGFDFGWLADFLERTSIPCLMVGLGAQAPSAAGVVEIAVPDGTQRFLKIVSERSRAIGVRGEFTADVLARIGIGNVVLTGCPSLYWTLKPRIEVQKAPFRDDFEVSVSCSRNVAQHSRAPEAAKRTAAQLLRTAMERGYELVLQDELPEIDLIHTTELDDLGREQVWSILARLNLDVLEDDYFTFVKNHARLFFSVEEWSTHIRTKDFSIGMRFHGNVIALINGVPAVVVVHDARTAELCDLTGIPKVGLEPELLADLRGVYEAADYAAFEATYATLYEQYVTFLEDNGVPHNLAAPAARASGPASA
jgi:hypothetical protein